MSCYAEEVRSVRDAPTGYPSVATFLDSDENFGLYRRFGFVQARLLLEKQDDLRKLELKLDRYDRRLARDPQTKDSLRTRDLKPEALAARKDIMEKLEKCFNEYGMIVKCHFTVPYLHQQSSIDGVRATVCYYESPFIIRLHKRGSLSIRQEPTSTRRAILDPTQRRFNHATTRTRACMARCCNRTISQAPTIPPAIILLKGHHAQNGRGWNCHVLYQVSN